MTSQSRFSTRGFPPPCFKGNGSRRWPRVIVKNTFWYSLSGKCSITVNRHSNTCVVYVFNFISRRRFLFVLRRRGYANACHFSGLFVLWGKTFWLIGTRVAMLRCATNFTLRSIRLFCNLCGHGWGFAAKRSAVPHSQPVPDTLAG